MEERREKAKAAYTLSIAEIDEEAETSRKLHEKLELATQRKEDLLNQRRERAAFCSQLKPKNTMHTDPDAITSFRVKLIMA